MNQSKTILTLVFTLLVGGMMPISANSIMQAGQLEESFACGVPSNLRVTQTYGTSTRLHWNAGSYALTYQIQIRNQPSYSYFWKAIDAHPSTSYLATGLEKGHGYFFRVRTNCGTNNWSQWSQWYGFNSGGTFMPVVGSGADAISTQLATSVTDMSIQPNPAANAMTVQLNAANTTENGTVSLFDLTGKLVSQAIVPSGEMSLEVSVATLQNGLYLLRFSDGENVITKKVIVSH
jgi:Secretion system C-terminal sorting domain/Fibronectin type III domain